VENLWKGHVVALSLQGLQGGLIASGATWDGLLCPTSGLPGRRQVRGPVVRPRISASAFTLWGEVRVMGVNVSPPIGGPTGARLTAGRSVCRPHDGHDRPRSDVLTSMEWQ
jgi:hypothetical protein